MLRKLMTGLALVGTCATAQAQTGVSDDRVSLPEGPGSLEGIGENISLNPNMGVMNYGVPITVPRGFPGLTPQLRLGYSSGGGSGVVGVGWNLSVPYIERSTFRGLPEYTADDRFSANGGTQLVRLPGDDVPTYRARYEGDFARYTWQEVGDGTEGYWRVEYPSGRVATFGATADGTLVPSARVSGPDGTFRYMVVDVVDPHGHRLSHTYQSIDGFALIRQMDYVFTDGNPEYSVSFNYEDRADEGGEDILSDAKAGFDERLTQRVSAINVFSKESRIRRYELTYEPYAESGGFTRLNSVTTIGLDGSPYPAVQQFGWSRSLEGVCNAGDDCTRPFVIDMGNIGVNIGVGRATLVDINGDALPDLVDTSDDGAHTFRLNVPSVDGQARFSDTPIESAIGEGSGFRLGTPFVQVLDVNGDGYADLLDARNGRALLNTGSGDWDSLQNLADTAAVGDALGADFGDGGLSTLRFVDIDNDKRIDLMRSTRQETRIFNNRGEDGFVVLDDADILGYDLGVDGIQMTDMNGDGLLDAVKLNVGGLRYRLNYGRGRWGDEVEVLGLPIDESELALASLDDLNGDGLADLVVVVGRQVKFAINRNGTVFSQITTLNGPDVDGDLPLRDATVSVIMADVNGNGSTDVVWLDAQGQVTALEMFPVRPNQLARVSNSLGMVTTINYTTSVQEMARDGDWQFTLPHPMQVVASTEQSDGATGITQVTSYRYRDGYYDGEEKQFRGFAHVEMRTEGDDNTEAGFTVTTYDVGAEDRYRHGRTLTMATHSGDRLLNTVENVFEDCALTDVPVTEPPVRFICQTGTNTTLIEGTDAAEHITLREEKAYNGYGNVVLSANHGVVAIGGAGCAPCAADQGGACGPACLGDELYTETDYMEPGAATDGNWFVGVPTRVSRYGDPDSDLKTETLMYYDGTAFEGLPIGQLTLGMLTRETKAVSATDTIATKRYRRDDDGNVIESLDANAEIEGQTHRTRYTIDADGLRVTRTEIALETPDGAPYTLARQFTYEPVFDKLANFVDWQVFDASGQTTSPVRTTAYVYDTFNRLQSITRPGDAPGAPGEEFEFDLQEGASRIIARRRSTAGGTLDIEAISCVDGRGRTLQQRNRLDDGRYMVSGLRIYNVAGKIVRTFQAFESDSAECDVEAPAGVNFTDSRLDATGRVLQRTESDEAIHGVASQVNSVFTPLAVTNFDFEDVDPDSPHFDTPTTLKRDGLNRLITFERRLTGGVTAQTHNVFDGLGRVVAAIDAEGNIKRQTFDLLDRVLRVEDPNKSGVQQMTYDAMGNVLTSDDGRGEAVLFEYDGANRQAARFTAGDPAGSREETLWDFDPSCDAAICTNGAGMAVRESSPSLTGDAPNITRSGYDGRGRSIVSERVLEGVPLRTTITYDTADRVTSMTYPDQQVVTYRHDAAARIVAIDGFVDAIEYDTRGHISAMRYSNGTETTFERDDQALLNARRITDAAGATLQSLRYTRDRMGNVLSIDDVADRLPQGATFEYDAWYRTLRSAGDDGLVLSQSYDLKHNVVRRSSEGEGEGRGLMGEYTYANGVNALTQAGDMQLAYDAAGHAIERGELRLDWDPMGRLRSATQGDTQIAAYAYANNHRRTARLEGDSLTLYGARTWHLRDGISTLYITLDRERLVRVENDSLAAVALSDLAPLDGDAAAPDGRITAGDAWVASAADAGILALQSERAPSAVGALLHSTVRRMFTDEQAMAWLHHDHLGSIVMATNADGSVIGERAFEATGMQRADATGYVDEYGFTGQEIDRATGLVHFDYRMLDPQTGRWLSADPKFKSVVESDILRPDEALNVYGYARNNYANMVDPNGLTANPVKAFKQFKARRALAKARARTKQMRPAVIRKAVRKGNFRKLSTGELKSLINSGGVLPATPVRQRRRGRLTRRARRNIQTAVVVDAQAPAGRQLSQGQLGRIQRVVKARAEMRRRLIADMAHYAMQGEPRAIEMATDIVDTQPGLSRMLQDAHNLPRY